MKKFIVIYFVGLATLTISSCSTEPKNYVTLNGKIDNPHSDSLVVYGQNGKIKRIKVNENGNFADTLTLDTANVHNVFDGTQNFQIFLRNGYDLKISFDATDLDATLLFSGVGKDENNYLTERKLLNKRLDFESLLEYDSAAFENEKEAILVQYETLIKKYEQMDSAVIALANRNLKGTEHSLVRKFQDVQKVRALNGQMAPEFINYENHAGGTVSLTDLRGKYVYLDLWATWCGPCKIEIPFLKELEDKYSGRNIEFVSISLDRKRDYEQWKKRVFDDGLKGIQLYYNEDFDFTKALIITGIPRFVLIDPSGKILEASAPRPSQPELEELLNKLDI